MANEQNLKPVRTKKEARDRGRRGGVASGKARKDKKEKRFVIDRILEAYVDADEGDEVAKQFIEDGKVTLEEALVIAQVKKAKKGDYRGYKDLMDRKHGTAVQKVEGEIDGNYTIEVID